MSLCTRRCAANLCLLAAALMAWALWRFPPQTSAFYPRCPVYFWLHLYCPGCGATRALSALLRGKAVEALRWNAMAVMLLPAAVAFFVVSYLRAVSARTFHWPAISNRVLALCLAATVVFTLVRNL